VGLLIVLNHIHHIIRRANAILPGFWFWFLELLYPAGAP
jgi:hypothetical protein